MSKICNYFVTLRCNDTCEFCPFWQSEELKQYEEKPFELLGLRRLGVETLNITGGEPLLREGLPGILKNAKELGFEIELTTNGILYAEKARLISSLVDRLYFSLDYPIASEHDRSRGVECFSEVLASLKLAKELGERPIINFTLTRDSIRFLPEMVELSDNLQVRLALNPVYDFYGTQGFESVSVNHIRYYARRKNVLVNLAALEFVNSGGNRVLYPRCRAGETTATIMPDGSRISPCFFNPGGKQGTEPVCSSCMRWPYMLPSFTRGFDKFFWLNWWSEFINGRKKA